MEFRRVVTGVDACGRAVVISAGAAPRSVDLRSIPDMRSTLVWATERDEPIASDGSDPTPSVRSFHPEPGSTRLLVFQFPPDSVYAGPRYDADAAPADSAQAFPGLAELFESDAPGMHTSETVDYCIVLAGEPVLELDAGAVCALQSGDIVVQNGTRHAWRNPGEKPATVAFVLVGASR
jgi:hypothetical protein